MYCPSFTPLSSAPVREWSDRHSLHVQPEDVCEAAILHNLHSHNDSAKLRGIVACSHLSERQLGKEGGCGSEEVGRELTGALSDECVSVHVTAAITLHCLGQESGKVSLSLSLLMDTLCRD